MLLKTARLTAINTDHVGKVTDLSVPQFIPFPLFRNPFAELTGANPTSIISVVIFAVF